MSCYSEIDPKWLSWIYIKLVEEASIKLPPSSLPPPLDETLPVDLIVWPTKKD